MKYELICQDCGRKFNRHGNRTRCKDCQASYDAWLKTQREEFNHVKGAAMRRDGKKCVECGSVNDLTVHHIEPLVEGGNNDLSNLITLCFPCHMKAHHG